MRGSKTSWVTTTRRETITQAGQTPHITESVIGHVAEETTADERPDQPIRNPKDRFGWRNPSGYSRRIVRKRPWMGNTVTYSTQGPFTTVTRVMNTDFVPYRVKPLSELDVAISSNLLNEAEIKCLNKLNTAKTNYAVMFAEAGKASSMISTNLLALASAFRATKRGQLRKALKALRVTGTKTAWRSKEVSSRWLELQYGWLPLVNDIYGVYQDFNTGILPKLSSTQTVKRSITAKSYKAPDGVVVQLNASGSYGWKVRLDYSISSPAIDVASKMGLTNPATIAWELTPWSFVIDWVAPIGSWLTALSAPQGLAFKGGSRTWFVKGSISGLCYQDHKYSSIVETQGIWKSLVDVCDMNRVTYTGSPIPIPYVRNPVNTGRALNALALLRSSFKR